MRKYNSKNAPALSHWNGGYFVQCPHRLKGRGKYVFQDHEQYDEESAEVVSIARAAIAKAEGRAE